MEDIAVEEEEILIPCGFTYALHIMSSTEDQQLLEYRTLLETHVDPIFAAQVPIIQLMLEEGVKVFTNIHMNWDGIQGIPLFELDWEEDTPLILKPTCRPISANILEVAEKEFNRLRGYLLKPSNSPVCSNIVVASKAADPFCGDYVAINKYIRHGHYPIPLIRSQLDRIQTYSLYADIDFKNAFHQVRIGPISSARLSITTPHDWAVLITFYARLDITYSRQHAYSRLYVRGVVRKDKALCFKHNMFLKMEKSMLVIH